MNFDAIANSLIEKKEITVKVSSRREYDNLRTRLCKYFSKHKGLLVGLGVDDESLSHSVCGIFDATHGLASFHLRESKRKMDAAKEYEIVEAVPQQ